MKIEWYNKPSLNLYMLLPHIIFLSGILFFAYKGLQFENISNELRFIFILIMLIPTITIGIMTLIFQYQTINSKKFEEINKKLDEIRNRN